MSSSLFFSQTFPFQLEASGPIASLSLPSFGAPPAKGPVLTSGVVRDTTRREDFEAALRVLAVAPTGAAPMAAAAPAPSATPAPLYVRYMVQPGDTSSSIAARFGIKLQYLLWNNPELKDGDVLKPGDMLFVPAGDGMLHYVGLGETLSGIAGYYGVGVEAILGWPGNAIVSPDQVVEDQLVFVPGGVPPASPAPEPTPAPTRPPVLVAAPPPVPRPAPPPPPAPTSSPPVSRSGMIWPFSGPISRGFGGGHAGIDIDGVGQAGASIRAATSGTVIFAGGDPCCGYGLYVDIRSPDGVVTRYAHLSRISVSTGQSVSQGQTIGIIGCTGRCTGTHLHFEVRINGSAVNPLNYLP